MVALPMVMGCVPGKVVDPVAKNIRHGEKANFPGYFL